ncbi:MAG: TonB-dependent receptor, partial [Opitutus sp.]|nr:TonB-dependent receptor [Opitutus sp.]
MNQSFLPACLAVSIALALVSSLSAQVAPAAGSSSSSMTRKDEPIVLSPFEVGSGTDRGYQSTAILQGGRGKIDLADVAGQVTVFTKEFLEDIAATTTDEAFLFSATTQTYFDNVNGTGDSRPGSRNIADDSGNSRGLGNIDKTRNYFRTTIEPDSYNTERFSLVSGANAVQFGLGGSAGTAESTSARANLSQNRQKIQLRTDSYGSERTVFDVSQVIIPKKLAVRAIALRENREYYIQPGYDDNRRAFVTTTYQPFKNTTVRIEGEYVHRRDARPPTTMARDNGYMFWLASQRAGNPQTYLNRAATAATAGRPAAPAFLLDDGTSRAYLFSAKPALFVFPTNSAPNFTGLQDVRNTVVVNIADGAGSAGSTQTLMDPGLPWNTNPAGWSRYNFRRSRNITG